MRGKLTINYHSSYQSVSQMVDLAAPVQEDPVPPLDPQAEDPQPVLVARQLQLLLGTADLGHVDGLLGHALVLLLGLGPPDAAAGVLGGGVVLGVARRGLQEDGEDERGWLLHREEERGHVGVAVGGPVGRRAVHLVEGAGVVVNARGGAVAQLGDGDGGVGWGWRSVAVYPLVLAREEGVGAGSRLEEVQLLHPVHELVDAVGLVHRLVHRLVLRLRLVLQLVLLLLVLVAVQELGLDIALDVIVGAER